MAEIGIGSRIRKSPFYDATIRAGVTAFTIYNRMYMPVGFGDPDAEYARLTEGVALWDVACERQVEISGPDAFALSNYLSSRDLTGMAVGRARYAPLCDHEGRLINDPIVLRVDHDRYWFSIADSEILLWAKAVARERGADVSVCEPDVSPLAIQGPKAMDVARDLFGGALIDSLGMFHHTPAEVDGISLVLCRSGWSKQGGVELFLTDGSAGSRLWDAVMEAGSAYGIGPGTPNQTERIETGLLSCGSDHDPDTDPIEAGLGAYVSLAGDHQFLGRTALEARLARPVRRPIVNVRLDGNPGVVDSPLVAAIDGEPIGQLRNAVKSKRLGCWIGLAQLPSSHAAPGARFEVELASGTRIGATVSAETFGAIQTTGT